MSLWFDNFTELLSNIFSVTCVYFEKLLQLNILCLMYNIFMTKWPALDEACHKTRLESQFAA
jgi:hypothetical protein